MMNRFAFSDRNGRIEFGPFIPNGRLPIAEAKTGDEQARIREIIEGICRHGYDGETLLVPGIPEADSDERALDALTEFGRRVRDRLAFAPAIGAWSSSSSAEPAPAAVLHAELGGSPETLAAIEAVDAERGPFPFNAGEILYSSWGYDQTNVDFYRVELRKEAGGHEWVKLQQIEAAETSDDTEDRPATMTGRVVPAEPHKPTGDAFLRKVHPNGNSPFVRINSYAFAYAWDGQPKRVSHYA